MLVELPEKCTATAIVSALSLVIWARNTARIRSSFARCPVIEFPQERMREMGWPFHMRIMTSAVSPIRPIARSNRVGVTFRAVIAPSRASHSRGAGTTTFATAVPSSALRSYDPWFAMRIASFVRVPATTGLATGSALFAEAHAAVSRTPPSITFRVTERIDRIDISGVGGGLEGRERQDKHAESHTVTDYPATASALRATSGF
jgi:hypothetical protein